MNSGIIYQGQSLMANTLWERLSQIDCSAHVEKKNGMTYLSWAWAWGKLKENCPDATFHKHLNQNGYPAFKDEHGFAFVIVTVTAEGQSQTEVFPVLNHANKPIENPNSFQINTAMQRCLTKAISYHGLGHYIYAGEDLPETVKSEQPSPSDAQTAPAADSSLSEAAGASPLTLAQKIANATSLQELNDLYSEYKDKIEALDAEVKAKAINAFSIKKAELKG